MKERILILLLLATVCSMQAQNIHMALRPDDLLIDNFEGDTFGNWILEGNAFGNSPVSMERLSIWGDNRFEGNRMASSFVNGDAGTGVLKSPLFRIERRYVNFLIGGGVDYQREYVALWIDGKEVKRSTGYNRRVMEYESWDVAEYMGKNARIVLVDQSKEGWGFINADCFYQSDTKLEKEIFAKRMLVTHRYLNIPVKMGAVIEQMDIWIGDKMVRNMEVELGGDEPDYWVTLEVKDWIGQELRIEASKSPNVEQALNQCFCSETPKEENLFYKEPLRPKVHFTSRRGWLNDPNGLVWHEGEWHLFYQHNPYGCIWGNMTWGHAVSRDLAHWTELGDVLHPDSLGPIFSGSVVVDKKNTLGCQQNGDTVLVAVYTSAGGFGYHTRHLQHSQSIGYSLDKGRNWVTFSGNPVLPTLVRYNRDPKVTWHTPTGRWIMVLYLDKQEYAIFSSPNLMDWTETDRFKLEGADECPDFFEMSVTNEPTVRKWVFTGANSTYLVGSFDGYRFRPETKPVKMDSGTNYYAVQTYSNAPDDRRIQIAWMNGSNFPDMPFNQQMSFPRELTLHRVDKGYVLKSMPVNELALLYGRKYIWKSLVVEEKNCFTTKLNTPAFYLKTGFAVDSVDAQILAFDINGLNLIYDSVKQILTVGKENGETLKQMVLKPNEGRIELDILSDIASVEIFVNQGALSAAFYHLIEKNTPSVTISVEGGQTKLKQLTIHELNSMYVPQ